MKKSELTQLTQIIEHIVAKEIRKQLPSLLAEVFQNKIGNLVVNEQAAHPPSAAVKPTTLTENKEEVINLKASLRELFDGTPVMENPVVEQPPPTTKQYTKNPIYNQILNETRGDLRDRERIVGAAAFQGGYSPALTMLPEFGQPEANINIPPIASTRAPTLVEGQTSTHAPMSTIPEGVSVLDIVNNVKTARSVKKALTRNYSQMMKLIDKKKGKI